MKNVLKLHPFQFQQLPNANLYCFIPNSDNESPVVDYSSDDSIYFGTDELGEHIYDDISEASNGVTNTVDEILVAEVYYIDRLNYTIDNYLQSSRLMGDPSMKAVYGNIEQIKQFHEETFYPDLKRCNKDIVRIAECFSSHILVGIFVYSMCVKSL